jgi:hypothetical protein
MQIHELTEASFLQKIKQAAQPAIQKIADQPLTQVARQGQLTNPTAYAKAQQNYYAQQAAKSAAKLQAQGYKAQPAPAPVASGTQQVTANIGGVSAKYSKTGNTWTNELGQPVTNSQSVAYLDGLLKQQPASGSTNPRSAQSIMTTPEFNQTLTQIQLAPRQVDALAAKTAQDPKFAQALLKKLGLAK